MIRSALAATFCCCCIVIPIFAQDSISISDYRYPETRAIDWKGEFSGGISGSNNEETEPFQSSSYEFRKQNSSYRYFSLNSSFLYFHTKDDHDHNLQLSTSGSYDGNDRDEERIDSNGTKIQNTQSTSWNGNVSLDWMYMHYLYHDGFHLLTHIAVQYDRSYSKYNFTELRNGALFSNQSTIGKRYRINFRGSLGFGYGRIRDGTVVFRALRIIERLQEDGVLTKRLSRQQMLELINRVTKRREYSTNFQRYEKFFVSDIVKELKKLGVVSDQTLDSFSVLRIHEAFNEYIQSRFFGWRVYYLFNDTHDLEKWERNTYTETYNNNWIYIHELGVVFGYPFSLYTHLFSKLTIELPVHKFPTKFWLNGNVTLTHQVTEKVRIEGRYDFTKGKRYIYSYDLDDL